MVNLEPIKGSEQGGARPIIVVSRDAINHYAINKNRTLIMVGIPTTDRANLDKLYPSHVELKRGSGGFTCDSVALCEQIRAIAPGERLIRFMGRLTEEQMKRLEVAIKITLDLD